MAISMPCKSVRLAYERLGYHDPCLCSFRLMPSWARPGGRPGGRLGWVGGGVQGSR